MAIYLHCQHCKTTNNRKAEKCATCGNIFGFRGKKYRVVVSAGGRRQSKMVPTLEVAQKLEGKWKGQVIEGEYNLVKKQVPRLSQIWNKYIPWAKENKKTWSIDQYNYMKHIAPSFADKPLDIITPFDIEKLMLSMKKGLSQRGKPYSNATRKHILVLLSRLFSLAEKWGLYDGQNPCRRVGMPKLNNEIVEHLNNDELERLLAVLENWPNRMSACFVKFALHTGMRRGELFKLKWTDVFVDGLKPYMIIRSPEGQKGPKGGKDVILPLSTMAVEILRQVPREFEGCKWVFYGKGGSQRVDFKGPWQRMRSAANLPVTEGFSGFRLHGLRHHFASQLVSDGVDLYTVGQLLSHKSEKMTRRYAHLSDDALRKAVQRSDNLNSIQQSKVINLSG